MAVIKEYQYVLNIVDNITGPLSKIGASTAALQGLGLGMTAAFTVPLLAIGAVAVESGLKVEQAYSTIQRQTGTTGSALASLKTSFNEVAANVPENFQKVATAMSDVYDKSNLLNQGIKLTGTALEGLTTKFLEWSRISGASVTDLVNNTAEIASRWNMTAQQSSDAMDMMNTASQTTGVNVTSLGDAISKIAIPATQLHLSFKDVTEQATIMTEAGLNANAMYMAMNKVVTDAAKTGEDANARWNEDIASLKVLAETGSTASLSTKQLDDLTKDFSARTLTQMIASLKESKTSVADLDKALNNSADSIHNSAVASETFQEKLDKLKNKIELAFAPLGKTILDILSNFITALTPVIEFITKLIEAFSKLPAPIQTAVVVLGAIVAAIGPALIAISSLMGAMTTVGGAVGGAGFLGLLLSPELLVAIAAIGGLVFIGYELYTNWKPFKDLIDGLVLSLKDVAIQAGLIPAPADWATKTTTGLAGIPAGQPGSGRVTTSEYVPTASESTAVGGGIWTLLNTLHGGNASGMPRDLFAPGGGGVAGAPVSPGADFLAGLKLPGIGLPSAEAGKSAGQIDTSGQTFADKVSQAARGFSSTLSGAGNTFISNTKKAFTDIGPVLNKAAYDFGFTIGKGFKDIETFFKDLPRNAAQFGNAIKTAATNFVTAMSQGVTTTANNLVTRIKSGVAAFGTWLFVSVPAAIANFVSRVKNAVNAFGTWLFVSVPAAILNFANQVKTAVATFGTWLLVSVPAMIIDFANQIKTAVGQFGQWIIDSINNFASSIGTAISNAVTGGLSGIGQIISNAISGAKAGASHAGGLVTAGGWTMPMMHEGGLATDEFPAVLQVGERVLSKNQNQAYTTLVNALKPSTPTMGIDTGTGGGLLSDLYLNMASTVTATSGDVASYVKQTTPDQLSTMQGVSDVLTDFRDKFEIFTGGDTVGDIIKAIGSGTSAGEAATSTSKGGTAGGGAAGGATGGGTAGGGTSAGGSTCSTCGGSGTDSSGNTCSTCGGSGETATPTATTTPTAPTVPTAPNYTDYAKEQQIFTAVNTATSQAGLNQAINNVMAYYSLPGVSAMHPGGQGGSGALYSTSGYTQLGGKLTQKMIDDAWADETGYDKGTSPPTVGQVLHQNYPSQYDINGNAIVTPTLSTQQLTNLPNATGNQAISDVMAYYSQPGVSAMHPGMSATPPTITTAAPTASSTIMPTVSPAASQVANPVTVYWKDNCPACETLISDLDKAGVQYNKVNIDVTTPPSGVSVPATPTVYMDNKQYVNPSSQTVIDYIKQHPSTVAATTTPPTSTTSTTTAYSHTGAGEVEDDAFFASLPGAHKVGNEWVAADGSCLNCQTFGSKADAIAYANTHSGVPGTGGISGTAAGGLGALGTVAKFGLPALGLGVPLGYALLKSGILGGEMASGLAAGTAESLSIPFATAEPFAGLQTVPSAAETMAEVMKVQGYSDVTFNTPEALALAFNAPEDLLSTLGGSAVFTPQMMTGGFKAGQSIRQAVTGQAPTATEEAGLRNLFPGLYTPSPLEQFVSSVFPAIQGNLTSLSGKYNNITYDQWETMSNTPAYAGQSSLTDTLLLANPLTAPLAMGKMIMGGTAASKAPAGTPQISPIQQLLTYGSDLQQQVAQQTKNANIATNQNALAKTYTSTMQTLSAQLQNTSNTMQQNNAIALQMSQLQGQFLGAQNLINQGMTAQVAAQQAFNSQQQALQAAVSQGASFYGGSYANSNNPNYAYNLGISDWMSVDMTGIDVSGIPDMGGGGGAPQPAPAPTADSGLGGDWHTGGIAGLPRFHVGLARNNFLRNDEILGVLQKGERIFSADDSETLQKKTVSLGNHIDRLSQKVGDVPTGGSMGGVHIYNTIDARGADKDSIRELRNHLDSKEHLELIEKTAVAAIERQWNRDMTRNKIR